MINDEKGIGDMLIRESSLYNVSHVNNMNTVSRKISEYEKIVNECLSKNQKYTDNDFPPSD